MKRTLVSLIIGIGSLALLPGCANLNPNLKESLKLPEPVKMQVKADYIPIQHRVALPATEEKYDSKFFTDEKGRTQIVDPLLRECFLIAASIPAALDETNEFGYGDYWQTFSETTNKWAGDCEDTSEVFRKLAEEKGYEVYCIFGYEDLKGSIESPEMAHIWGEMIENGAVYVLDTRLNTVLAKTALNRNKYLVSDLRNYPKICERIEDYKKRLDDPSFEVNIPYRYKELCAKKDAQKNQSKLKKTR